MKTVRLVLLCMLLPLGALADDKAVAETTKEAEESGLHIMMHKNPGCGCCDIWAEHLRSHGFTVATKEDPQIFALKDSKGIPRPLYSCHTALIDGYFIEGHVPAQDIMSLLRLRPDSVTGLAVPGMPLGSPGMEHPRPQNFNTIAMLSDGNAYVFAQHKAGEDFSDPELK